MEELENIQKEVDNNAISLDDVAERLFSLNLLFIMLLQVG